MAFYLWPSGVTTAVAPSLYYIKSCPSSHISLYYIQSCSSGAIWQAVKSRTGVCQKNMKMLHFCHKNIKHHIFDRNDFKYNIFIEARAWVASCDTLGPCMINELNLLTCNGQIISLSESINRWNARGWASFSLQTDGELLQSDQTGRQHMGTGKNMSAVGLLKSGRTSMFKPQPKINASQMMAFKSFKDYSDLNLTQRVGPRTFPTD